ncbi:hypothetical protein JCM10450v2_003177 [Rhodotorula kratochvilovae]
MPPLQNDRSSQSTAPHDDSLLPSSRSAQSPPPEPSSSSDPRAAAVAACEALQDVDHVPARPRKRDSRPSPRFPHIRASPALISTKASAASSEPAPAVVKREVGASSSTAPLFRRIQKRLPSWCGRLSPYVLDITSRMGIPTFKREIKKEPVELPVEDGDSNAMQRADPSYEAIEPARDTSEDEVPMRFISTGKLGPFEAYDPQAWAEATEELVHPHKYFEDAPPTYSGKGKGRDFTPPPEPAPIATAPLDTPPKRPSKRAYYSTSPTLDTGADNNGSPAATSSKVSLDTPSRKREHKL